MSSIPFDFSSMALAESTEHHTSEWLVTTGLAIFALMEQASKRPLTGLLALASLFTAASAIFAASCCVLPLVLGGLGASTGLFSVLEVLTDYRTTILVISGGLVAVAWFVYFRRHGARGTALALAVATLFVGTAAAWDHLEGPLLRIVRASR
jgi:mercuric ion transport protein